MAQNHFTAQYHSEIMSTTSENFFPHGSVSDIHHSHSPLLPDQCLFEETDADLSFDEESFPLNTSTTMARPQMGWSEPNPPGYDFPKNGYYDLATPSIEVANGSYISGGFFDDTACPRTWTQPYDLRSPWLFDLEDIAVPEYLIHPPREDCMEEMTDGRAIDYATDGNSRDFSHLSISRSPTVESLVPTSSPTALDNTPTLALSSKASEYGDDEGAEGSQSTLEERISDEPYAKLIYRALLGAQGHRMALQEIYQWFIENTDKSNSTTSGWRNSIRHNLSMNAVSMRGRRKRTSESMD
jgi:Forkhead domain